MTDNEKAATFIGWYGGGVCNFVIDHPFTWRCEHGNLGDHIVEPPDMSDPTNYMKALENIGDRYVVELTTRPGSKFSQIIVGHKLTRAEKTIAATAVKVLAALYDAEHKDDTYAGITH